MPHENTPLLCLCNLSRYACADNSSEIPQLIAEAEHIKPQLQSYLSLGWRIVIEKLRIQQVRGEGIFALFNYETAVITSVVCISSDIACVWGTDVGKQATASVITRTEAYTAEVCIAVISLTVVPAEEPPQ